MDPSLTQFYRQYLQQVNEPIFPAAKTLLDQYVQEQIYRYMFDPSQANLPPARYRKRILKTILERIDSVIEDPDEEVGIILVAERPLLDSRPRIIPLSISFLTLLSRRSQMPSWKPWLNCVLMHLFPQAKPLCRNPSSLTFLHSRPLLQS